MLPATSQTGSGQPETELETLFFFQAVLVMAFNSVSDQNKRLKLSLSGSKPEAFIPKLLLFNAKRSYKFILPTHH